jgi:hypothetical protein
MLTPTPTPTTPGIAISAVPPYGVDGFIGGVVSGVDFATHRVAPYIHVEGLGWYTKPTFLSPTVLINPDGTFSADVATGGIDNRATLYCAALIPTGIDPPAANGAPRIPASLVSLAIDCAERYGRTLEFAGRTWAVKEAPVPVGPGWNRFSDLASDVFVDELGLHLTIHLHDDGFWWATEVVLLERLGFGTYSFQTASRLETVDRNATFGAFTWDSYGDQEPGGPNREIDIEDSRWGNAQEVTTSQAVVQPFNVAGNLHRYTIPDLSTDPALTRFFTWAPEQVRSVALLGYHSPSSLPQEALIDEFLYMQDAGLNHFIPTEGRAAFRFNLWLNNVELGGPPPPVPANGQTVEVVVTDFSFAPLP